jgi:hypothetical protein
MLDPQISALLVELGYEPKSIEALVSGAVYLTIVAVAAAIPTGAIAGRKGRSVIGWVLLALTVPLLPLLLVSLLSRKKGNPPPV